MRQFRKYVLGAVAVKGHVSGMTTVPASLPRSTAERDRLALARQAFHDFYGQCFWSYPRTYEVTEASIPLIVRELRAAGGHAGYRLAAELCR